LSPYPLYVPMVDNSSSAGHLKSLHHFYHSS